MDCVNHLWFNRLPLVRLYWAKGQSSQWSRSALFRFAWRLFSPVPHTKTTQEDLLQELQHLSRANRKQEARMVRVKYAACTSHRLQSSNVKMLKLRQGDLCAYGELQSVTESDFRPPTLKSFKAQAAKSSLTSAAISALKKPTQAWGDGLCPAAVEH